MLSCFLLFSQVLELSNCMKKVWLEMRRVVMQKQHNQPRSNSILQKCSTCKHGKFTISQIIITYAIQCSRNFTNTSIWSVTIGLSESCSKFLYLLYSKFLLKFLNFIANNFIINIHLQVNHKTILATGVYIFKQQNKNLYNYLTLRNIAIIQYLDHLTLNH